MFKKSFYLIAVLGAGVLAGCSQPDPTPINSTHNIHPPKAGGVHSSNANGSVRSEAHETSHREPQTSDEHAGHSTMQTAPNAASQPFDLQFLDTMTAHHQGAIEMARVAQSKSAADGELKTLAAKMIADQEREIAEMKRLREQFYAGKPSALNMEMAGMANSMRGMNMSDLSRLSGKEFDQAFISQMTPHHQGALVMAREALAKAEHAEIKTLANQIVQAQEAEIKQMETMKAK